MVTSLFILYYSHYQGGDNFFSAYRVCHAIDPGPRKGKRSSGRAGVAELVDALDLGSSGESRGGSSPSARTTCFTAQMLLAGRFLIRE